MTNKVYSGKKKKKKIRDETRRFLRELAAVLRAVVDGVVSDRRAAGRVRRLERRLGRRRFSQPGATLHPVSAARTRVGVGDELRRPAVFVHRAQTNSSVGAGALFA